MTWKAVSFYGIISAVACLVVSNGTTLALARGITWAGLLLAATTLWMQVPVWATEGLGAAFEGVHGNRNIVSYTFTLTLAGTLVYAIFAPFRLLTWLGVGLFTAIILTTGSSTGIIALAAILITAAWVVLHRRLGTYGRVRLHRATALSALTMGALVPIKFDDLLTWLGRNSTLSGRLPIWEATIEASSTALIGGHGFGTVWFYTWLQAPPNPVKDEIETISGSPRTHGHNSLVDLLPQVGLIGIVLALTAVAYAVWRTKGLKSRDSVAAAVLLPGLLVCSVTEPMLAIPSGWFVLSAVLVLATRRDGAHQVVQPLRGSGRDTILQTSPNRGAGRPSVKVG
ncbi:O-antigen ligase family protein [Georgenia subflava]|nr:O-antigen ligase family protein [Georgenia subflava]